jgi:hypothetical protein
MNIHVRLLFYALFITLAGYGQTEKKTIVGLKAGFNQSDVTGIDSLNKKTGYTGTEVYAAFFTTTRLTSKLRLGAELLYSFTDTWHFAELPVHLQYQVARRFQVLLGPKLDVLVSSPNNWFKDGSKTVGISAETGARFTINRKLFMELRYARGFSRQLFDVALDIQKARRQTIRLGIGLNFIK